jgi:hypothetical protein
MYSYSKKQAKNQTKKQKKETVFKYMKSCLLSPYKENISHLSDWQEPFESNTVSKAVKKETFR